MKLILSHEQSDTLKGFAIIGIILHNFCHQLPDVVRENEFQYLQELPHDLWNHIITLHKYLPLDLCSFFGHYGVALFVFISGYGLTKKYERTQQEIKSVPFYRYNLGKLWKLMIFPWLAYMVMDTFGYNDRLRISIFDILAQLTLTINLFPQSLNNIQPGPYWYFGLTAELYIVYHLIFYRFRSRKVAGSIICTSLLLQILCLAQNQNTGMGNILEYLRYNFTGWLLPFYMGIEAARHPWTLPARKQTATFLVILSLLLLFGGSFNAYLWLLLPVPAIFILLFLLRILPNRINDLALRTGRLSSALFVMHPLLRPYWIHLANNGGHYIYLVSYLLSAFGLALGFRYFMHLLSKGISKSI